MFVFDRTCRNRDFLLVIMSIIAMSVANSYSAYHSAPLFDEPAHFASGVILARKADAGYFKVNPPLNKWITALVAFGMDVDLPSLVPSSQFLDTERPEFEAGDKVMDLNHDRYSRVLMIARTMRVLMMLLGAWTLWLATEQWACSRRMLCVVFWCTSPLLLGHGWIVSADAPSGVAMCLILWMTVRKYRNPSIANFAWTGFAWGLAVGTKFTFGPLYLFYPLLVHLSSARGWTHSMIRLRSQLSKQSRASLMIVIARNWTVHAMIAYMTLNSLYLFHEIGVPIAKHNFSSKLFTSLTSVGPEDNSLASNTKRFISSLPSPFPKSLLGGVDQQLADMDFPLGAYLLGERISGEIHWFFLVGFLMKEQLAVLGALTLAIVVISVRWVRRSVCADEFVNDPLVRFSLLYLLVFATFMSTQCNLVWNSRYLIPACPLIYILATAGLPRFSTVTDPSKQAAVGAGVRDYIVYGLIAVITLEFCANFPNHFSYINPLFGGSHRVPIALNDSNVDYGQDLFYIRIWKRKQTLRSDRRSLKLYGLLSGHGRLWLRDVVTPASGDIVQSALRRKELEALDGTPFTRFRIDGDGFSPEMLVISRGLTDPERWAIRYSTFDDEAAQISQETRELVRKLLHYPPDEFITPVVAVYFLER